MANKKNFGAVVIFAGGLFSKIIGFAREIIFANWFGVGDVATAFRIAQSGFLLPTHSLIGETLSSGLLPLYKKYSDRNRIFPIVLRYLAIVYAVALSFVISISLYLFAEFWVKHIAPGVSAGPLNLAADFLKIMSLAVPFYVVGGLFSYIEAAHGKYSGISLRPVLMNVGAIAGAACAVYFNVDMYVALGFSVGHVFIFLWGFFRIQGIVKRDDHSLRFKLLWFPIAKQFFKTIAPLMFVPFVMQLNMLIERIVSSRYGAAVIPSVDYARVVSDTFIQLVSVPLGVVTMSMFSGKDSVELKTYACNVFVVLLAAFIPLSLWSAQFASEIVNLIFVRGAFDSVAANLTSTLLFWFSLGMSFGGAGYYLMKVLNTQLKNRIVMIVVLAGCIAVSYTHLTLPTKA